MKGYFTIGERDREAGKFNYVNREDNSKYHLVG